MVWQEERAANASRASLPVTASKKAAALTFLWAQSLLLTPSHQAEEGRRTDLLDPSPLPSILGQIVHMRH